MIVLPRRAGTAQRSAVFVRLIILAFIVTGCATTAKPPALAKLPVPQWESSKLIDSMGQRRQQFRSVRALHSVYAVTRFLEWAYATRDAQAR